MAAMSQAVTILSCHAEVQTEHIRAATGHCKAQFILRNRSPLAIYHQRRSLPGGQLRLNPLLQSHHFRPLEHACPILSRLTYSSSAPARVDCSPYSNSACSTSKPI